jgi:hypothetical protein
MIHQIAFLLVFGFFSFLIFKRFRRVVQNIKIGKDKTINDRKGDRFRNLLLIAFGQKKMFKRPIPAIFHLFIYVGFFVINIEVLEFVIDGLAGTHRIFAPYLGGFYTVLMNIFEFLAVGVLAACVVFLIRRNVLKLKRFWAYEMTRWPRLDANLILTIEIVLMLAILTMNASAQ